MLGEIPENKTRWKVLDGTPKDVPVEANVEIYKETCWWVSEEILEALQVDLLEESQQKSSQHITKKKTNRIVQNCILKLETIMEGHQKIPFEKTRKFFRRKSKNYKNSMRILKKT